MGSSLQILDKNLYFIIKLTVFTLLLSKIPYAVLGDIAEFKYSDPEFFFFFLKEILLVIIFVLLLTNYKNHKIKSFLKFYLLSLVILFYLIYINNKFNINSIIFFLKNITLPSILIFTVFLLREKIIVRIFTYVIIINILFVIYQLHLGVESETGISKHLYLNRPKGATDNPNTLALIFFFYYSFFLQNIFVVSSEKYDDYYKKKNIFYHLGLMSCVFFSVFTISFATMFATFALVIFICIYYFFLNKFKIAIIFFITQLLSFILSITIIFLFYKSLYKIFSYKIFYLIKLIKEYFLNNIKEISLTENFLGSRLIDYIDYFNQKKINIISVNEKNNKNFFNLQDNFNFIIDFLSSGSDISNQIFFYDSDFLNLAYAFGNLFVIIFGTFIFYIFCEQNINKKKYKYQNVEKINIFLFSIVILLFLKKFIPISVANYFFFIILGYRILDVVNNFKNKKKFV
jgi:hypothetical protein